MVNVEPGALELHTATVPPWLVAMCLTIARPEAGAAGGARARRVDPVEPLEDPVQVGLGDADALVGDRDLDRGVAGRRRRLER